MLQLPLFPDTFHTLVAPSPNAIATCQVCISVCTGVGAGMRGEEGGGATINNGPLGATVQQLGPDNGAWPLPFVVATTTRDTHAPFPIRLWL